MVAAGLAGGIAYGIGGTAGVAGMVIAAFCLLVVLAAIGWGIYEVYQIGHPAPAK